MARSLQERMTPMLQKIGGELIAVLPEHWTAATMRVEVKFEPNGDVGMSHSISSEQHPRFAVPGDEIFAATYSLFQLCQQAKQPWSALVFTVEQADEGWKFTTSFEYPD